MIAFNKELIENTFLLDKSKNLKKAGFITREQLTFIKNELPILKSQDTILIRIGFFILGCLLFFSVSGVIVLFTSSMVGSHYEVLLFFYSFIGIIGSEFLSKEKFHNYGLDDAFILGFQGCFCVGMGVAFDSPLVAFITMAIIGLVACGRYINTISILFCLVGITATICYAVIELKVVEKLYLPFILFAMSMGMYLIFTKLKKNTALYFYFNAIQSLQGFSLLLGYFSMNYLVVRQLSEKLMGFKVTNEKDIHFAFLFYLFTFLIPILYIIFSLFKKNRIMLIIGFLTFAFSIYTIQYYYSILPIELALIYGGITLFAIMYFAIQKIKNKEEGITFKPDRGTNVDVITNVEALITATQVDSKPIENQSKMPFGGGGFSGGGSEGSF